MEGVRTIAIRFTSRISIKLKDTFYTFEAVEERAIEKDVDLELARQELWDTVHDEVDKQVTEAVNLMKNER